MDEIKISVIIPVYNASKYLRQCINSVLGQTLKNIEVICIDDGSIDNSLEILKEYQIKDNRIIVCTQENSGAAVARNKGLDIAKGDYIAFMDPDDYYPDRDVLFSIYERACDNNALIAGGSLALDRNESHYKPTYETQDERFFDKDAFIKYEDYQYDFYYQRFIYKKKLIDENNIRFPLYRRGQDVPFFVKAMLSAKEFYAMERKTYCYRVGHKNINWQNNIIAIHAILATNEIIEIAKNNNLERLLDRGISRLLRYSNEILNYNGDLEVLKIIYDVIENLEVDNDEKTNYEKIVLLEKIQFLLKIKSSKEKRKIEIVAGKGFFAKVSVIIPVYNVEKYLAECLDSISDQTLKDIEIICVNDGSSDNSLNILKRYADIDKRIIVLSQENGGLSVARNTGINFAHGKYIYFCDSDDKLELTALEELYNRAEADKLDILYFDAEAFFENEEIENKLSSYKTYYQRKNKYIGTYRGKELFNSFLKNHDFLPSACLSFSKKDFLLKNNLLFEPGILHEDNIWSFKCIILADRAGYLDKNLYHRRVRANSIVSQKITFEHVYGYFISAIKAIDFFKNINLSDDEFKNINKLIESWLKNSKDKFSKLDTIEKSKYEVLNIYERNLFNFLVINSNFNTQIKDNKPIIKTVTKTQTITKTVVVNEGLKTNFYKMFPYYKKHGLKKTVLKIKEKLSKFLS